MFGIPLKRLLWDIEPEDNEDRERLEEAYFDDNAPRIEIKNEN